MKILLPLFLALSFIACDNELNVIEQAEDLPIVYGFISLSDTAQYIRIEKSFIDENTSALELAQDPANLYYENLEVNIVDLESGATYPLERVLGADEGFPRNEGVFISSPNYLYKINSSDINIIPENTYQLQLSREGDLPLVTASTNVVGESRFIRPNSSSTSPTIDFSNVTSKIAWRRSEDDNARVYDVFLDFNYQERMDSDPFENRSIRWKMATGLTLNEWNQPTDEFFSFLGSNIEAIPDMTRRFASIDLTVVAGNNEIFEFTRVADANLGITSTQDIPVYTNLNEGRGIFGSTYTTLLEGIRLSNGSLDSLYNSTFTQDLNFTN